MRRALRVGFAAAGVAAFGMMSGGMFAQAPAAQAPSGPWMSVTPTNDLPNPYNTIEGWAKLPAGREWGSTSAVEIDKDGKSVWVGERCGTRPNPQGGANVSTNSCWDAAAGKMSALDPVLKFDANGNLVKSFGAGMMVFPHGIHVDRDGNVWLTDGNDNLPRRRPGQPADAPLPPKPEKVVGHQVFKFSPDGKLLLTLGKPGGNPPGAEPEDPASFYQPNDVITYPNGNILVAEGHGGANARLILFDKSGKFIKQFGKRGTGLDGEFDQPHGLAFDSKGRLFVADRSNNRIQILDPESFKTLDTWYQFSRLSGIFIDTRTDTLYGADSESGSVNPAHGAWKRGMRIGSARDGKVMSFIPDPSGEGVTFSMEGGKPLLKKADGTPGPGGTLAAEGVAVDKDGVIYGAEVGPHKLQRYVKK
jgi:DNA-binding beta-propeller fold protein YncE